MLKILSKLKQKQRKWTVFICPLAIWTKCVEIVYSVLMYPIMYHSVKIRRKYILLHFTLFER